MYSDISTGGSFIRSLALILLFKLLPMVCGAQNPGRVPGTNITPVGAGWAKNSVNAVVFRKNSLVTFRDTQYIAYYDSNAIVIVGKRKAGEREWVLQSTGLKGNASDAHNSISMMVDGEGYLHLAWDHHNNPLRYCRSLSPGSLTFSEKLPMTGLLEQRVTYPEFYRKPDGNLLFFYRNGESGKGNLVMNEYNTATGKWTRLHDNLIDGEGKRNAYCQSYVDSKGIIHISWVWRESPDVASNHDLCYARSKDGGKTWEKSTGEKYTLPITASTAEYSCRIPENSELINQTSMCADSEGNPFIATYWREKDSAVPQYHIVYKGGREWKTLVPGFRKTPFSLSGTGTKKIPVSRPQVLVKRQGRNVSLVMIFRDAERGSKASALVVRDISQRRWYITDLTAESLGDWEPTYDTELWKEKGILNLFIQNVEQVDGEGKASMPPTIVKVLEWRR